MERPSPKFVRAQDVANYTGVSVSLVRQWTTRSDNPIPSTRLPGGRGVRYQLSEVRAWLQNSEGAE